MRSCGLVRKRRVRVGQDGTVYSSDRISKATGDIPSLGGHE